MDLSATIPLPTNWQSHIADFIIRVGPPTHVQDVNLEAAKQHYKRWGVAFDRKTGRPYPFQRWSAPFRIVYTPFPAYVVLYRNGQFEEDYAILLCTLAQMLASGVRIDTGWTQDSGRMIMAFGQFRSRPQFLEAIIRHRASMGDFQIIDSPSPPDSLLAQIGRFWTRSGRARIPEAFRAEIILPLPDPLPENIFEAAKQGNLGLMQAFLDTDVQVDMRNEYNQTALMVATNHNQRKIVEILISHQSDVNAHLESGWTVLMSAAMVGNEDLMRMLLVNGAMVEASTLTCLTALRVAVVHGHDVCVRLLMDYGASLDTVEDLIGYTTLMFACSQCSPEIVELLIKKGADVNVMALNRMTPLRCAETNGRQNVVALLKKTMPPFELY